MPRKKPAGNQEMTIESPPALPGKIVVRFEESDFDFRLESGEFAWCAAKDEIKQSFPFPTAQWNRPLNAWLIDDSDKNRTAIRAIKDKYFMDKDQIAFDL
jgi:hypothetical protein